MRIGFSSFVFCLALISPASAQTEQADIDAVADAVRSQGRQCEAPYQVERDTEASSAEVAVWTIGCTGGRYRVTFDGDASVEVVPIN